MTPTPRRHVVINAVRWLMVPPAAALGGLATCAAAASLLFLLTEKSSNHASLQVIVPTLVVILAGMLSLPAAIWLAVWTAPEHRLLVSQAVYWLGVVAAAVALYLLPLTMWFVLVPAITGRFAVNAVSIRCAGE